MYIKKIIFFYFIFFIFSCGGNYSGNEGEIKESLTFQTKSFMAVGNTGSIITSDDGIEWESITSGTAQNLNNVSFANNTLIIVGDSGSIMSINYTSWRKHYHSLANYRSTSFGKGNHVFVSNYGDIASTNDWNSWKVAVCGDQYHFNDVVYDGSSFLAIGNIGIIFKTEDISSCTQITSGVSYHLYGIIFSNSKYIIVGRSGRSS